MHAGLLGISLDTARNIALVVVAVFVIGGIAAAWIMKTIMQKVATAAVLALLAFAVWSQRTALDDCADKVRQNFALDGTSPTFVDTDCSFFGTEVTISDPRSPGDA
ncbi:MAG: hypothetical protein AAGG08_10000 [Actinomycetota bacterium]